MQSEGMRARQGPQPVAAAPDWFTGIRLEDLGRPITGAYDTARCLLGSVDDYWREDGAGAVGW